MANELNGRKVAVLATDGVEQVELTEPVKVLKAAGATVHVVSPKSGSLQGWNHFDKGDMIPVDQALDQADPDLFLLPGRYSLLNQPALDRLFPMCAERGVHVVVGGPYNSGLLAGGRTFDYQEAPAEMVAKRDRIAAVCERHGADIRSVALQFCAAHPVVAAIIPGAKRPDKVRENARLMQAVTPAAVWEELRREALIPADAPVPA